MLLRTGVIAFKTSTPWFFFFHNFFGASSQLSHSSDGPQRMCCWSGIAPSRVGEKDIRDHRGYYVVCRYAVASQTVCRDIDQLNSSALSRSKVYCALESSPLKRRLPDFLFFTTFSAPARNSVVTRFILHMDADACAVGPESLPPELERKIFETTAVLYPKMAPTLLRVARRVLLWSARSRSYPIGILTWD
jgi:hypothetical protein